MKAESQTLQQMFQSTVRYVVPLYQRPYVWRHALDDPENDRLGPFWEDVKQTVDRLIEHQRLIMAAGGADKVLPMTPHFFGAVVIDGPVKAGGGITSHEVIDGQQRLTTAQLLIAAATHVCETYGRTTTASRLRKLWMQDADIEVTGLDKLKLAPTQSDKTSFGAVMADSQTARSGGADKIRSAYSYLTEELAEWAAGIADGEHEKYFAALRDTIYEHLLLVVIELQGGDNPQGIFESLNAQGERLLAIDLVKNHVFRAATRAGMNLARLDSEVWSARFGDQWWREDVRQGRYRRPRAELFLMHWLAERTNAEISATGLFVEYTKLATEPFESAANTKDFIDSFVADAGVYRGFDSLETGTRERLFSDRRAVLDVGVVFPVMLRLWRLVATGAIDRAKLIIALQAIESWLVRRMVLRLTTKPYNKNIVEALGKMTPAADPVVALVDHLRSFGPASSAWWPDDQTFRTHITSQPIYGTISQARVRMLLETAEIRLRTPKTEPIQLPRNLSIEHIIPQSWEAHWPLLVDAPDDIRTRRLNHLHRLGNLTLVTSALNPALSNDPWQEKRRDLMEHSALRLNARLVQEYPDAFDEDAIDQRGEGLADLLVTEWPGPAASCWGLTD